MSRRDLALVGSAALMQIFGGGVIGFCQASGQMQLRFVGLAFVAAPLIILLVGFGVNSDLNHSSRMFRAMAVGVVTFAMMAAGYVIGVWTGLGFDP